MKDILVVGLGNALMADEGVGLAVVRELAQQAGPDLATDVIELGTGGLDLVHALAGRRKAVIVDCALMDEPAGVLRRFTPESVRSRKAGGGFSPHHGDVLETIALARRLGECPSEVVIFGVQPASVAPGEGLSPALRERLPQYVAAVRAELEDAGDPAL